jgi:uncharacterized protein YfiM (DUF2279 family)
MKSWDFNMRYLMLAILAASLCSAAEIKTNCSDSLAVVSMAEAGPDKWFGKDKADHFFASTLITALTYYAAKKELHYSALAAANTAFGVAFTIGISKEAFDHISRTGIASKKDLLADILGIGFGYLLLTAGK